MSIPLYQQDRTYYAVFQVQHVFMVGALGEYAELYKHNPKLHADDMLMRNIELLNTLLEQSDERFTYDFRITSQPNPDQVNYGSISLSFICAIRASQHEAEVHAESLYHLLNAQFTDMTWTICDNPQSIIYPWPVAHAVSLIRRSEYQTLTPVSALSHTTPSVLSMRQQHAPATQFYFIHPFILSRTRPHYLFDYLLQRAAPASISIRFQRTQLTTAEVTFCQQNAATYDQRSTLTAIELEQLTLRQQWMRAMLERQQQLVTLVTIDVVSPTTIPTHLITMVGNLITQSNITDTHSPGGMNDSGGYQVMRHGDYRAVAHAYQTVAVYMPKPALETPEIRLPYLFDVSQAAVVFRIPTSSLVPLPGIEMQSHRNLRPPRDLSTTGTCVGEYLEAGKRTPIVISEIDRTRHSYILGQTGTGKSTVLKSMILDDIMQGRGVCAVDPHGDLITEIIAQIPPERHNDVIVIDPTNTEFPVGLNVLEYDTPAEREIVIQHFQGMIMQMLRDQGVNAKQAGPAFERYLRNNAYWVTQDIREPGTVLEFYQMMEDKEYYKRWEPIDESDQKLVNWRNQLKNQHFHETSNDTVSFSTWINSKFENFIFDTRIRLIFGQKRSTINFFDAMNSRKIILVNLSRGLLSEVASSFVGYIVLAKLQQAALKRAELPHHQRGVFSIYVDEFQNYTTESFVSLLSESRKYGIALTLANQFLAQISNPRIIHAILGNVGTVIAFRVGIADGKELAPRFAPEVTPDDLINLPNWHAYVSTQVHGQSRRPFSMHTIRPVSQLNINNLEMVIRQSSLLYGTPRAEVEETIRESLRNTRDVLKQTTDSSSKKRMKLDITLVPLYQRPPAEKIRTRNQTNVILNGGGIIAWSNDSLAVSTVGLPPCVQEAWQTTTIAAFAQQLPPHAFIDEFVAYATTHNLHTMHDLLEYVTYSKDHPLTLEHFAYSDLLTGPMSKQTFVYEDKEIKPVAIHFPRLATAMVGQFGYEHQLSVTIVDIAISHGFGMMLDNHHVLTLWHNAYPAQSRQIHNVQAIDATIDTGYVLTNDHRVIQVTMHTDNELTDLPPIRQISAGKLFAAFIDVDGKCHLSPDAPIKLQQAIPKSTYRQIACGFNHVLGLTTAGKIESWSSPSYIEKEGLPTEGIPDEVINSTIPFRCVTTTSYESYALREDGNLFTWGWEGNFFWVDMEVEVVTSMAYGHNIVDIKSSARKLYCQTDKGDWITNDQDFPPTLYNVPFRSLRIMKYGSFALINPDASVLSVITRILTTSLSTLTAIDADVIQTLTSAQMQTVGDVLRKSRDDIAQIDLFVRAPELLTPLCDTIVELLHTNQITTHDWPNAPFVVKDVINNHPRAHWYANMIDEEANPPR